MPPTVKSSSANFAFLAVHDPLLDHLGALAERYFADDPSTALVKLRQFGEVLAQRTKLVTRIDATRVAAAPNSTADRQTMRFARRHCCSGGSA